VIIAYIIGLSIFFWLFFIVFAVAKDRMLPKAQGSVAEVPVLWVFLAFGAFDVAYNVTLGSLIFWQLPARHRWTLSARLRYILRTEQATEWRFKLARFICLKLIEPWLPQHCALR